MNRDKVFKSLAELEASSESSEEYASDTDRNSQKKMMSRGNNVLRQRSLSDSAIAYGSEGFNSDHEESDTDRNPPNNFRRQETGADLAMASGSQGYNSDFEEQEMMNFDIEEFVREDMASDANLNPQREWSQMEKENAFGRLKNERKRKRDQTPDNLSPKMYPKKEKASFICKKDEAMRSVAELVVKVPNSAMASGDDNANSGNSASDSQGRRSCGTTIVPNEVEEGGTVKKQNGFKCTVCLKFQPY